MISTPESFTDTVKVASVAEFQEKLDQVFA
jgi:hypothetical protein